MTSNVNQRHNEPSSHCTLSWKCVEKQGEKKKKLLWLKFKYTKERERWGRILVSNDKKAVWCSKLAHDWLLKSLWKRSIQIYCMSAKLWSNKQFNIILNYSCPFKNYKIKSLITTLFHNFFCYFHSSRIVVSSRI